MKNSSVKNLSLSAMFLAIGLLLPFLTGQLQQIGNMLLPMHIPVFLCTLICGWRYGLSMAFILPILRSAIFGMPPMYPTAIGMAFELAAYAFVAGFLYEKSRWQCVKGLYRCMLVAMIVGRAVWGVAEYSAKRHRGFRGVSGKMDSPRGTLFYGIFRKRILRIMYDAIRRKAVRDVGGNSAA